MSNINQIDGADTISDIDDSKDDEDDEDNSENEKDDEDNSENEDDVENNSEVEDSSDDDGESVYDTEDEVDSEPTRAVLVPSTDKPGDLEVDTSDTLEAPTSLPLCVSLNARSVYNKETNLKFF